MTQTFKIAFEEDIVILEAVHRGMLTTETRHIDIGTDAGNRRARKLLQQMIDREASAQTAA